VFVVGCLGDWESAAKVLFESESLRGDIKKGKKTREKSSNYVTDCVGTLCARDYKGLSSDDVQNGKAIVEVYENHPSDSRVKPMGDVCQTITSSWGTGGGNVPLVQAYSIREDAKANNFSATPLEVTPALQAMQPSVQSHHAQTFIAQAIGFDAYNNAVTGNVSKTLDTGQDYHHVPNVYSASMAVRRLTPRECERLQGFKDDYTIIPWKKGESPDGHRYKALGNSMAVPVMKWIGERINEINKQI
jgi:DNA (cytosine-5)-methyltransferase 1